MRCVARRSENAILICSWNASISRFSAWVSNYTAWKWVKHTSQSLCIMNRARCVFSSICRLLFPLIIDDASQYSETLLVNTNERWSIEYVHILESHFSYVEHTLSMCVCAWYHGKIGILKVCKRIASVIMLLSANYCRLLPHLRFALIFAPNIYTYIKMKLWKLMIAFFLVCCVFFHFFFIFFIY